MSERKKFIEDNDLKVNMTTIFLLPLLEYTSTFLTDEFIGAYIIDVLQPKLVLTFENSDTEGFKDIVWIMQQHDDFVSLEYDDDNKEVVVTFNIPKRYNEVFLNFKKGRYTKFDKEYKEILLDYHGRKTGDGKCIYMIDALYPDFLTKKYRADKLGVSPNDLPNGEVMSIPNMDMELYYKTSELNKIKLPV